jgi:hypothetical protein
MTRSRAVLALRGAAATGALVRVFRDRFADDRGHYGFVVGLSDALVALHRVTEDSVLDGYTVLPLRDVTRCDDGGGHGAFYTLALRLRGSVPARPRGLDLAGMPEAVASASASYPILGLEQEDAFPGEMAFGRVRETTWAGVRLDSVSPTGWWEDDDTLFPFDTLTALEFDTAYATSLALVTEHRDTSDDDE